jgi:hypothetical protein
MTDGLVQKHPGPPRAKHDRHLSGRRIDGLEVNERLSNCLARELLAALLLDEMVEPRAPASAGRALLPPAALLDDHMHVHANERAHIGFHGAVTGRDKDNILGTDEADDHLPDTVVLPARLLFYIVQQVDLLLARQCIQRVDGLVELMPGRSALDGNAALLSRPGNSPYLLPR